MIEQSLSSSNFNFTYMCTSESCRLEMFKQLDAVEVANTCASSVVRPVDRYAGNIAKGVATTNNGGNLKHQGNGVKGVQRAIMMLT